MRGGKVVPIEQRFFKHVLKTDTCWLWIGTKDRNGYGMAAMGKRLVYAHRISYAMKYGEFDRKMCVLHACDVPACIRPEHLSLGTHKDNMRDMAQKGRAAYGERNGASKLTVSAVKEIRRRLDLGETQESVRVWAGISSGAISNIANFKTWRHAA